jgi:hypothetical protein
MGDAELLADLRGVVDVLPGAAGARALHRFAMIVELERDPDHLRARARGEQRATDESTPPDMATTIRASAAGLSSWKGKVTARLYPAFTLFR